MEVVEVEVLESQSRDSKRGTMKRARTADGVDFSVVMELLPKLHSQINAAKCRMEQQEVEEEQRKVEEEQRKAKVQEFRKAFGSALQTADRLARSSGAIPSDKFMLYYRFNDLVEPGDSFTAMYLRGKLNSIWRRVEKGGDKTEFVSVAIPAELNFDYDIIDLTTIE